MVQWWATQVAVSGHIHESIWRTLKSSASGRVKIGIMMGDPIAQQP